jgi:hypothetical protein
MKCFNCSNRIEGDEDWSVSVIDRKTGLEVNISRLCSDCRELLENGKKVIAYLIWAEKSE